LDGQSWCFFFFLTWSGIQDGRLTFLFRMSIFARIPFPGLEADLALGCFFLFLLRFFLLLSDYNFLQLPKAGILLQTSSSSLRLLCSHQTITQTALGGHRHRFPMFSLKHLFLFHLHLEDYNSSIAIKKSINMNSSPSNNLLFYLLCICDFEFSCGIEDSHESTDGKRRARVCTRCRRCVCRVMRHGSFS